jgi:hypothetical protein
VITAVEYFAKPASDAQQEAAEDLLARVAALLILAQAVGAYDNWISPHTGTRISGSKDGDGDGGFRTPGSRTGAATSAHRDARAVDVYDPLNRLDDWITDATLERVGLYREAPSATPGWCHLQTRAPGSGKRTFYP